jgi:uncharacterized membrane protein YbhN (UPF0104 family)
VNKLLRAGISVALLSWIAWKTDWNRFSEAFVHMRFELWLAGVGFFVLAQMASAFRWNLFARALGFDRSFRHLAGFYFIGAFFNLILPTSVGGDVVRAWYLDGRSGRRLKSFLSVFLDRLSGLAILLAMACSGVLLSPVPLEPWITWSVWGVTGGTAVFLLLLVPMSRWFKLGAERVEQVRMALGLARQPRLVLATSVLSLVVQTCNVVIVWLIAVALQADAPASFFWVLVPMVSLLTMLPISVNGMGVREVSTALMLAPYGVERDMALTLSLLWFAVYFVVSLAGGSVYLLGRFPRPADPALATEGVLPHGSLGDHPDQGRARQPRKAA